MGRGLMMGQRSEASMEVILALVLFVALQEPAVVHAAVVNPDVEEGWQPTWQPLQAPPNIPFLKKKQPLLDPDAAIDSEFTPADGDVYWGDTDANGDPHGRGTFIRRGDHPRRVGWDRWHPGEEMYDGFWWHGIREGAGVYIDASGSKLKGKWSNGYCYFYEPLQEKEDPSNSEEHVIQEFKANSVPLL